MTIIIEADASLANSDADSFPKWMNDFNSSFKYSNDVLILFVVLLLFV